MSPSELSSLIKSEALKLGFYACGISQSGFLADDSQQVELWLEQGKHGEMSYLERNREKRYNPSVLVDGCKSVITVIQAYYPPEKISFEDKFKFSIYTYGNDYHQVVKNKLFKLLNTIKGQSVDCTARVFIDSAPVLDRAWAVKAGLGFIGKNTMLINRHGGSYFFIGHILTDLELEYERKIPEKNFCGSCSLCLKACPTQALEPFSLDSRKCISYLTIEYKGVIPGNLKTLFNNYIFGCDICQEVCPWNRFAVTHCEPSLSPSDEVTQLTKDSWRAMDKETFNKLFHKSAFKRAGFEKLKNTINFLDGSDPENSNQ